MFKLYKYLTGDCDFVMYIRIIFISQIDFQEKPDTGVVYLEKERTLLMDGMNEWEYKRATIYREKLKRKEIFRLKYVPIVSTMLLCHGVLLYYWKPSFSFITFSLQFFFYFLLSSLQICSFLPLSLLLKFYGEGVFVCVCAYIYKTIVEETK